MLNESTKISFQSDIEPRHGFWIDEYDLILKYSVELSIDNYELGEYTIGETRETKAAAELIADHLNKVEKIYIHDGPIESKVIGETDGTPIKSLITYNGEYGESIVQDFIFQKQTYQLDMKNGDKINNNIELGVMRALELWKYVKTYTNIFIPKPTYNELEVITHKDFGGLYRRSTLIVRLYDLKKED